MANIISYLPPSSSVKKKYEADVKRTESAFNLKPGTIQKAETAAQKKSSKGKSSNKKTTTQPQQPVQQPVVTTQPQQPMSVAPPAKTLTVQTQASQAQTQRFESSFNLAPGTVEAIKQRQEAQRISPFLKPQTRAITTPEKRDTGVKVVTTEERKQGAGIASSAFVVDATPEKYLEEEFFTTYRAETPVTSTKISKTRGQTKGEFLATAKEIRFREMMIERSKKGFKPEDFSDEDLQYFYGKAGREVASDFSQLPEEKRKALTRTGYAVGIQRGALELGEGIREIPIKAFSGGLTGQAAETKKQDFISSTKSDFLKDIQIPQTTTEKIFTVGTQVAITAPSIAAGFKGVPTAFKQGGVKGVGSLVKQKVIDAAPFGYVEGVYGPKITSSTKFITKKAEVSDGVLSFEAVARGGNIKLNYKGLTQDTGIVSTTRPQIYLKKAGGFTPFEARTSEVIGNIGLKGELVNLPKDTTGAISRSYSFGGVTQVQPYGSKDFLSFPIESGFTGKTGAGFIKTKGDVTYFLGGEAVPKVYKFGSAGYKFDFRSQIFGRIGKATPQITDVSKGFTEGTIVSGGKGGKAATEQVTQFVKFPQTTDPLKSQSYFQSKPITFQEGPRPITIQSRPTTVTIQKSTQSLTTTKPSTFNVPQIRSEIPLLETKQSLTQGSLRPLPSRTKTTTTTIKLPKTDTLPRQIVTPIPGPEIPIPTTFKPFPGPTAKTFETNFPTPRPPKGGVPGFSLFPSVSFLDYGRRKGKAGRKNVEGKYLPDIGKLIGAGITSTKSPKLYSRGAGALIRRPTIVTAKRRKKRR